MNKEMQVTRIGVNGMDLNKTAHHNKRIMWYVSQTPNNLQHAFKQAGEELGRPYTSIQSTYYSKLRKSEPVFLLGSKDGAVSNTKNTPAPEESMAMSVVKKALSKLTRKQRLELVDLIINY